MLAKENCPKLLGRNVNPREDRHMCLSRIMITLLGNRLQILPCFPCTHPSTAGHHRNPNLVLWKGQTMLICGAPCKIKCEAPYSNIIKNFKTVIADD